MIEQVGLIVHTDKPDALRFTREAVEWLQESGLQVYLEPEIAHALEMPRYLCDEATLCETDLLIAVGATALSYALATWPRRGRYPFWGCV